MRIINSERLRRFHSFFIELFYLQNPCGGSLLGIALAKPSSFPVDKVSFMQIDPMTFTEFLLANGDENLAKYLETVNTIEPISDANEFPKISMVWKSIPSQLAKENKKFMSAYDDLSAFKIYMVDVGLLPNNR